MNRLPVHTRDKTDSASLRSVVRPLIVGLIHPMISQRNTLGARPTFDARRSPRPGTQHRLCCDRRRNTLCRLQSTDRQNDTHGIFRMEGHARNFTFYSGLTSRRGFGCPCAATCRHYCAVPLRRGQHTPSTLIHIEMTCCPRPERIRRVDYAGSTCSRSRRRLVIVPINSLSL